MKKIELKIRNRIAMNAWARSGAGRHTDKKYEAKNNLDTQDLEDEIESYWNSMDSDEDSE